MKIKNIINGIVWSWAFGSFTFLILKMFNDWYSLEEVIKILILIGFAGFGYITIYNITKYIIIKFKEWKK